MTNIPIRTERLNEQNAETLAKKYRIHFGISPDIEATARKIVRDVIRYGDKSLIKYTRKLDGVELGLDNLRIDVKEFRSAYSEVSEEQIASLKLVKKRIEKTERLNINLMKEIENRSKGMNVRYTFRPIENVGCYAPGGRALYPSSLLMATVPARIAGVHRIVICTPPSRGNKIDPLMLVAADMCGIREYYKLGGAQAIAALAYGTESIRPVQKIVGPGGPYVAAAKTIVSSRVAIDIPAGPSELLIIADEYAKDKLIARDMISQAEHGEESICGLISLSEELAERVGKLIPKMLKSIQRSEVTTKALRDKGFILVTSSPKEAATFVNLFAPEHLEILTKKPGKIVPMIRSSGLILLGSYTPVAASDYCVGINHILPTAGFANAYSGLSVFDFEKRIGVAECSYQALRGIASPIKVLAKAEGLPNHALAVEERLKIG